MKKGDKIKGERISGYYIIKDFSTREQVSVDQDPDSSTFGEEITTITELIVCDFYHPDDHLHSTEVELEKADTQRLIDENELDLVVN